MKCILLSTLLALGCGLTGVAQTTPKVPAEPLSGPFLKGDRAPAANFTGVVYVATLVKNDATFNCASSNVTFTPGARSHWHTHAAGQILLVTDGVGYYQTAWGIIKRRASPSGCYARARLCRPNPA